MEEVSSDKKTVTKLVAQISTASFFQMNIIYRSIVFRPGRFFHTAKDVIESLEKEKNMNGKTDMQRHLEGNPAVDPADHLPNSKNASAGIAIP